MPGSLCRAPTMAGTVPRRLSASDPITAIRHSIPGTASPSPAPTSYHLGEDGSTCHRLGFWIKLLAAGLQPWYSAQNRDSHLLFSTAAATSTETRWGVSRALRILRFWFVTHSPAEGVRGRGRSRGV